MAYGYNAERITKTDEFEAAFIRALASDSGTLIEIMLSPEIITTRQTLSEIQRASMARLAAQP